MFSQEYSLSAFTYYCGISSSMHTFSKATILAMWRATCQGLLENITHQMAPHTSFAAVVAVSLLCCIAGVVSEALSSCFEGSTDCQAVPNLRVVAFTGSLRKASCNAGLLRYAVEAGTQFGLDINIITADLPLFNTDMEYLLPAGVVAFRDAIEQSDAVLLGVDEINYSFSGTLKNALDWASRSYAGKPAPFVGKPVDLMSIGMNGFSGGTSAQAHLRQVMQFLQYNSMYDSLQRLCLFLFTHSF